MLFVSFCSCLCPIDWSQVLSQEWRWSCSIAYQSSADRRCSNSIWVINNFIAYWGATYIRGLTVIYEPCKAKVIHRKLWTLWIDCCAKQISCDNPANTLRNNNVVITSKRRYFDKMTSFWRNDDSITSCVQGEAMILRLCFLAIG